MSLVVERSFKTARDVVAGAVPRRRHHLGRSQAPASRTANEEEVVVQLHAKRLELTGKTLDEARVHGLIGKGLPLDEDSPFADGAEVWNAHIGPLRAGAHIDKLRARTRGEALPSRLDINSVDRLIAVLHAQMTIPNWLGVCGCLATLGQTKGTDAYRGATSPASRWSSVPINWSMPRNLQI
jgi:hypothetical protein